MDPIGTPDKSQDDILAEADRLAAEFEAELNSSAPPDTIGDGITPEMLENMDPAQLQQFLAQFEQKKRKSQAFYTRKQTTKTFRKKQRIAQERARVVSRKNGGGKTISRQRRTKKAA